MNPHFHVLPDPALTSEAAADYLVDLAKATIEQKGRFILSLAGGSTPKAMYQLLAGTDYQAAIDWNKVIFIWGDERCVPETSPDSNARMVKEAWLNHTDISSAQILTIDGTLPPAEGARAYELRLKEMFAGQAPVIDLCLLGLGDDGHTASLFPHTSVLQEKEKWVSEVYVEKMESWRISLTAPIIQQASTLAFLVSGSKKAEILPLVINGPIQSDLYPSQMVMREHPNVHWFLDEAAATNLELG